MLEKDVEGYLKRQVKDKLNGLALKFVSPGFNGVPDRIVLLPGARIVFIETKAPGKKLRKLQNWVCNKIREFGFVVLRIDTKERVNQFVKWVLEGGI